VSRGPTAWWEPVIDRGLLPDPVLAVAIRARVRRKLRSEGRGDAAARAARLADFVAARRVGPVTEHPDAANAQHYEVPTAFYELVLGPRRKYSAAWWPDGVDDLAAAEEAMLELTGRRAELADGQRILELGCGWGSLTLWMAERYPGAEILAVSNSSTQRAFIEAQAAERGLVNVRVQTIDVADLEPAGRFDRVVSVEMLEHVRNHGELLSRIARWLEPDGRCFAHVFSHRELAWSFEHDQAEDWMARWFFTGGIMPSDDLLPRVTDALVEVERWWFPGVHYERTLRAWLARLDERGAEVTAVLADAYGPEQARAWRNRWRLFLLASAELWGYRNGDEFGVTHHLFAPSGEAP
jgi:cyclopropane-fatty-acyl-phospholipid synthase